jgi:prevent-host-death family protein
MTVDGQMALKDVKNHLSEVVDQVEREHDRVVITKHGRPAAVILSVDDLASLEESLEIMGRPRLVAQIRQPRRARPGPGRRPDQGASSGTAAPVSAPAFDISWSPTARRALTKLPEKVGTAVIEFIYGPLATNSHRVGKPLRFELQGLLRARRGDFRIIYRISDVVTIVASEHRADAYRPR